MSGQPRSRNPRLRAPSLARSLAPALAIAAVAVALAAAARFGLVEPPAMAAACDPAPWDGACTLRTLLVGAFHQARLGWAAVALALLATITRRRDVAGLALAAGCAGAVLYSADASVPAALLAALVYARPPR